MLSESVFAKTVYLNMSIHPITMRCCGYDVPMCPGTEPCEPYPIDFYHTLSTTIPSPISTSTKISPNVSNTYCTYHPTFDTGGWGSGYCVSTPPSTTQVYGRGFVINETGTIPAGVWSIGVNTSSTTSTGVGRILVYVWKMCAVNVGPYGYYTSTLLFRAQGTRDHITTGTNLETITVNQPSFNFGSGKSGEFCYLVVEYHLNVSSGTGGVNNRSTLVGNIWGSNITYPTPINLMYNVNLNSPESELELNSGDTFVMNCTPSTDDSLYGINMSFEYNYSTNPSFIEIPTTGSLLIANATRQENVRNDTSYSRLITVVGGNDYYVRCRLYNSTHSIYSQAVKVVAREPANLKIADFRIYTGYDMSSLFTGSAVCIITSTYGSNIPDPSTCASNLLSNKQYKVLVRLCNDRQFSKEVNISAVVHSNLTKEYMGVMGVCGTGDTTLAPLDCNWNSSERNGVYINASNVSALVGGSSRSASTCQWYAYNFTTGSLRSDTWVHSNLTTYGASSGNDTQVRRVSILIKPQSEMNYVILNSPSVDLKLMDESNFTMNCTPYTNGGYGINLTFEYNSTTQGWSAIPTSGGAFTINGSTDVDVVSGVVYSHSVRANLLGTYWVRCRMSNATHSLYSVARKVEVYPGYLSINLSYPAPEVYNSTNYFIIGQYSTFEVNASARCDSLGSGGGCGNVRCSIRYNSTTPSSDRLISEIQGAVPFYVISANMSYDFRGIKKPSSTHWATVGVSYTVPTTYLQTTPSYEPSNEEYSRVAYEDEAGWEFGIRFFDTAIYQQFRFEVNESIDSIKKIKIYYKGWSFANRSATCDVVSYLTKLYVWNFSSNSWSYVGAHSSPFNDVIQGEFGSGVGSIVTNGSLYLLVSSDVGQMPCLRNVSTDYIKVDVELVNKSSIACGNLSLGQVCSFSWLVNATGVNEVRTIDVNCSSTKATVVESNSADAYIKITGVEVHTDKGNYRSCGAVYYKVSIYDENGKLRDENISVRVYNPSGAVVNESKVQTRNGVFQSFYNLPPGSAVGRWLIKAISCAVTDKPFYVGIGNASEFWKMEVIQPEKVKFAPGEQIPITLRFYNQAGDAVRVFGLLVRVDEKGYGCSYSNGAYTCLASAPSSPGVHSLNIFAVYLQTGRIINETRYFYVGG
ncbi:MAG: hypothetical protein QXF56_00185 [Candidatus Micrarchaeia archaeon]